LMRGGGKPTMMEEWKRVAIAEPDRQLRANHAFLAQTFAELTRHLGPWNQALKGRDMRESTVVNDWIAVGKAEGKAEGTIETRRNDILRLLELRFPGQVPVDCVAAVESQADLNVLSRWLDAVVTSPSPAAFRTALGIKRRK
jgi:hypothetical protein